MKTQPRPWKRWDVLEITPSGDELQLHATKANRGDRAGEYIGRVGISIILMGAIYEDAPRTRYFFIFFGRYGRLLALDFEVVIGRQEAGRQEALDELL